MALVCEQFHQRPDAYARWLWGERDIPPEVTRLDWHAFNVAAAAFLAAAHKQAQDAAEHKAKSRQSRDRRGRFASSSASSDTAAADFPSDPLASATNTYISLPESLFASGGGDE